MVLGAGTYCLDRPVTIRRDDVVIRGQGADKTRLIFRYAVGEDGVAFYTPAPNAARRARQRRSRCMRRRPGWRPSKWRSGTQSSSVGGGASTRAIPSRFAAPAGDIPSGIPDGPQTLTAVAGYRDGVKHTTRTPVMLDRQSGEGAEVDFSQGAITFLGQGAAGPRIALAEDGQRGAMTLRLSGENAFRPGDCLMIDGPATQRWKRLTHNACQWGTYRRYMVRVNKVDGDAVTLAQPLRLAFPTIDGAYVQRLEPIRRCGIEDVSIEQTENLWITAVLFRNAWNCWARGVRVKKCGRHPVYGDDAKFCEIRDCRFDDAWFKGGGGTAYVGWERAYDCLMDHVETFDFRHAPLFQWAASGCVIRNSVFHRSDGQWHSGWTNENLIEQCVIESAQGNGGYGYGLWASPPEDTAHGPNGPRNVVYHCDVRSPRAGLWMGGMNEAWLILHNRFVVDKGEGVFAKTASFDHIIQGNVFVLKSDAFPMVRLATEDCVGVELIGNQLYGGNGALISGLAEPAVNQGNRALPLADAPRPQPATPSIFAWQRAQTR